jgi:hypothetical protein
MSVNFKHWLFLSVNAFFEKKIFGMILFKTCAKKQKLKKRFANTKKLLPKITFYICDLTALQLYKGVKNIDSHLLYIFQEGFAFVSVDLCKSMPVGTNHHALFPLFFQS